LTNPARLLAWAGVVVLVLVGVAVVIAAYARSLRRGRDHLAAIHAQVARIPLGTVEYLLEGEGPFVLVSHGITGGVDQARGLASTYLGSGYRLVLPSRFGYLSSSMPPGATPAMQAEAFVQLLDTLGIARVFVLGNSAGGTAALHFAINHPERCRGLVLISSNVPGNTAGLPPKPAMRVVFGSDFVYWGVVRLFSKGMLGMFVPTGRLKQMGREKTAALANEILLGSLPISRRTRGVLFDMYASNPSISKGLDWGRITSPTLVVHAVDDPAPPIEGARLLARSIGGAQLAELDRGGHLLLGREKEVRERIRAFVAAVSR
jgi:pimeloyl-ACP methyl ester carboxylesterase